LPQARGAAAIARPLHDRHALLKQQKKRIEQVKGLFSLCATREVELRLQKKEAYNELDTKKGSQTCWHTYAHTTLQ